MCQEVTWPRRHTVTLDLVGARLFALNAELRDLQQRVAGMECGLERLRRAFPHRNRFSGMEARFTSLKGASLSSKNG